MAKGVPHDHVEFQDWCFRCHLSRDEAEEYGLSVSEILQADNEPVPEPPDFEQEHE